MNGSKRWLLSLLVAALMSGLAITVSAQGSSGTLVVGQPLVSHITTAGQTLSYDYVISEPRQITLQALGDTAQPTLTILSGGTVVAQETNASSQLTISLSTLLQAGSYVVQVGSANNSTGLVILVLQSETALTSTPLTPGVPVAGAVSAQAPLAIYTFSALNEEAFLFVRSTQPGTGVIMRLTNTTSGQVDGQTGSDVLGVRFRIPADSSAYQVEIQASGAGAPFTVCVAAVSASTCEAGSAATQPTAIPPQAIAPTATTIGCTVSASAGGSVNIRQSASTTSIIVETLASGDSADVIGISPDKSFYNILYKGANGWIAVSVVTSSGDCSGILVINPPPIIPMPTQPPQPTQQAVQPPPSGPCIITIMAPTFVYTTTNAIVDDMFDQVQPGVQLQPSGRLADNSWWQVLEYGYPEWIETSNFGHGAQTSGNCTNLPVVAHP